MFEPLTRSSSREDEREAEVKRLIGEIAKAHNIVIGPGDPLFVMMTCLELVLDRYLERSDAMLQGQQLSLVEMMEKAQQGATKSAELLITAAADYVAKTARSTIGDLSAAVVRAAAAERAKVEIASRDAKRFYWLGAAAFGAVFSILIGVGVGNWLATKTITGDTRCNVSLSASR